MIRFTDMNDTIFNQRQLAILELLRSGDSLSRSAIIESLSLTQSVASITVIRDLRDLVDRGMLESIGRARATLYLLSQQNPTLRYINMRAYFSKSLDVRDVKVAFDRNIFSHLKTLYNADERRLWDESAALFQKQKKVLSPMTYKREIERFLIDFAWKSSQIEGNTYDLIETETLLKDKIRARGHSEEEATMLVNHKDAFEFIQKHEGSFRKNLTENLVLQLHQKLIEGLGVPVGIRREQVRITGTRYIPPSGHVKLAPLFEDVIHSINRAPYAPDKALIASSLLAYLQPFADGNKRTSRMLANALLIAHGYYPLSYRDIDATEYRKAIILIYEQNNLYHIKRLCMEQRRFAVDNYFR